MANYSIPNIVPLAESVRGVSSENPAFPVPLVSEGM